MEGADQLLTPEETAALLATNIRTLETWRRRGTPQLPFLRLSGKMVRYQRSAVRRFLEDCTWINSQGGRLQEAGDQG